MTNVEKLNKIGILEDIREQLGAKDENDTSRDERINHADNDQIMRWWSSWVTGAPIWWTDMKKIYDQLEEIDKQKTKT